MATKKKTAQKTARKSAPRTGATSRKSKFHGVVVHTPPASGAKIASGDHVVVAVRELSFGALPEIGRNSELWFGIQLATTGKKGERVEVNHDTGVFFHVRDGSSLGVVDWVVFDGPVRQHLSLRLEIVEVENAARKRKESTAFARALVDSVGKPSPSIPDPIGAALGIFPRVFGAVVAANADDQVLKHFTSLRTAELAKGTTPPLVAGTHLFEKRRRATGGRKEGPALVTVKLRVQRAGKA